MHALLGADPPSLLAQPAAASCARFLEHFIDGLRARPLTLEIRASEVHERNGLSAVLEAEREPWSRL